MICYLKAKSIVIKYIIILFSIFISCSHSKSNLESYNEMIEGEWENPFMGEWKMIEWDGEPPVFDIIYKFYYNGEYTDSRSEGGIWNYEYYAPDSLILYHHGFYGERYKILKNFNDTLIMHMKESVFYGAENGEDFEAVSTEEQPIFVFIRQ